MKQCGLLLIASLVLADTVVSFHRIDQICSKDIHCVPNEREYYMCEHSDIQNCSSLDWDNPAVFESFFSLWTCNIYKSNQLNCSWSTHELPEGAQYSASFHSCIDEEDNTYHPLHCSSNSDRNRVECHGQLFKSENVMVKVKVSVSNHSLVLCETFVHADIVDGNMDKPKYRANLEENLLEASKSSTLGKLGGGSPSSRTMTIHIQPELWNDLNQEILEPPRNMTAFTESHNLEIKWSQPKDDSNRHCFDYELNINNDTLVIHEDLTFIKKSIDLTRTYSIQIRSKWKMTCASNNHWGEWSKIIVVEPTEKPYPLNWYVIASIAFVLPMILLAFLLVCKFQKLSKKLFPSIPGPSENVKMLLQKDDFSQVMPPKQGGFEAEEGTQIVQVTS